VFGPLGNLYDTRWPVFGDGSHVAAVGEVGKVGFLRGGGGTGSNSYPLGGTPTFAAAGGSRKIHFFHL
jgi:hypothetical protein